MQKKKICLLGDSAVGKTTTIIRYVRKEFVDVGHIQTEYPVPYIKKVPQFDLELEIRDIPGGYRSTDGKVAVADYIIQKIISGVDAVFFVCDLVRKETYTSLVNKWLPLAERELEKDFSFVIVGNKADLVGKVKEGEKIEEVVWGLQDTVLDRDLLQLINKQIADGNKEFVKWKEKQEVVSTTKVKYVDDDDLKKLALRYNVKYFKTSAKLGHNVELAFTELCQQMIKKN